jgi:hypothetical protein
MVADDPGDSLNRTPGFTARETDMRPQTDRSDVLERHHHAGSTSPSPRLWESRNVAMDDREDQEELFALLILREDRLRDRRAMPVENREVRTR